MTDAMTTKECIDSQTHGGSCCEGGRRPVVPFSERRMTNGERINAMTAKFIQEQRASQPSQCVVTPVLGDASPTIAEVQAERGAVYGPPEVNMAAIAKCWSGLLMNYYKRTDLPDLTPAMVALMESAGTKACRLASTPTHPDSQLDYLSYGEIHHGLAR